MSRFPARIPSSPSSPKVVRVVPVILGLFLLLLTATPLPLRAQSAVSQGKPKLVVGIVVEQMRYDYIARYWKQFGNEGFKRIINEGTSFENAYHNTFFTQSASGHASIATGTTPSIHGIIGNRWYNHLLDKETNSTDDDSKKSVGGASYTNGQQSPHHLLTNTFADQLKLQSQLRAKVAGIALDPASAILSTGHSADLAFWFDDASGSWITSSYYTSNLPEWVETFNNRKFPAEYLRQTWTALLSMADYENCVQTNLYAPGIAGRKSFPYNFEELSKASATLLGSLTGSRTDFDFALLKCSPSGNTFTKDFAIAAIDAMKLGYDEVTDFLSISFSATEKIGSAFGPSSIEVMDTYIRLDRDLAHLLSYLDATVGKENVLIYLTSNHGSPEIPEYQAQAKIPVGNFNYLSAVSLLKSYLNLTYGEADWVEGYYQQQLYLNRPLIEERKLSLEEMQKTVARFMIQFSGVAHVMTASTLENQQFTDGIFGAMQRGFNQKRSGDVLINLMPGWAEKGESLNSSSSPYPYDTHVPLILYGGNIPAATVTRKVEITALAPTLSRLLGLPEPDASLTEPLIELTGK